MVNVPGGGESSGCGWLYSVEEKVRRKVLSPLRCLTDNDIVGLGRVRHSGQGFCGHFLVRESAGRSESGTQVLRIAIVKGSSGFWS